MTKPHLIMDQHFRQLEELFRPAAFAELQKICHVQGGVNWPMERDQFMAGLPFAQFVVAAKPVLSKEELHAATHLKAVIEVSGTFQAGLDYEACADRGIEVLSCAPGFQAAVAEMAVGLMIAGGRGIVEEHERFRDGAERWLDDNIGTDFSLYGQTIGCIGFGSIAQECHRLLKPFAPRMFAFDPWLKAEKQSLDDVTFLDLEELVTSCRCILIAATPTEENYQLLSRSLIQKIPRGTLVVVISRAHLVDFDALVEAANDGRIRLASDVFPKEPVARHAAFRRAENVIWSPHRAAAVEGGRHPIGDMIVHDVKAILAGSEHRQLQTASPERIQQIVRAPLAAE